MMVGWTVPGRAAQAQGAVNANFPALPHISDPERRRTLLPGDQRRLPTRDTYIYQNTTKRTRSE